MKILFNKKLELDDNEVILDIVKDGAGDAVGADTYIQVVEPDEGFELEIEGQIHEDAPFVSLAALGLADNSVSETIVADGLYAVDGAGLSAIKLSATEGATVYIKVLG